MKRLWSVLLWAIVVLAAWWLVAWLAARALIVDGSDSGRADAIVVLSGSSAYIERAQRAAQLFRQGRGAKIVVTNDGQQGAWSSEQQRNPYTFERVSDELKEFGVPADHIVLLPQRVSSTYEEASVLHDWAAAGNVHSLLVVTSGYHSRRAEWTFNRLFQKPEITFSIEPVPPGQQLPSPVTWWWYPRGWRSVAAEYLKIVYYQLSYR